MRSHSVQGVGLDQLTHSLLSGWWRGNRESASPTFWFQLICVYMLVGSKQVKLLPLMGASVPAKRLEDVACVPRGGTRAWGASPKAAPFSSLLLPCPCIPSLPWLARVWTCPWISGKVMEAGWSPFPITKKWDRISLMAQRLRRHTPNEGGLGWSLVREPGPTCHD